MAHARPVAAAGAALGAAVLLMFACARGVDRDEPSLVGNGGAPMGTGGTGGQSVASSTVAASSSTGSMCAEQPCKLVKPQCGCNSGEQCTWNAGMRSCVPDGSHDPGEICSGASCKAGALCLSVGSLPTCRPFCATDDDCFGFGAICIMQVAGFEEPTDPKFCSDNCDPVNGAGCPPSGKCELGLSDTMQFYTLCGSQGSGLQGAPCTSTFSDCAAGHGCFTNPSTMMTECLRYCMTSSPSCPSPTTCVSLNPPAIIGSVEYGACL